MLLSDINIRLDTVSDLPAKLSDYLFFCIKRAEKLIGKCSYEQAHEIIDCIHVVPDIIMRGDGSWSEYWKVYVKPYMKKWNDGSLLQFKDAIRNL